MSLLRHAAPRARREWTWVKELCGWVWRTCPDCGTGVYTRDTGPGWSCDDCDTAAIGAWGSYAALRRYRTERKPNATTRPRPQEGPQETARPPHAPQVEDGAP